MATSYTSLLGLALPVTGELSGTWGDTVNNYITNYLDAAVAGVQIISGSQTAVTLSVTNGSSLVQVGAGATGSAQYGIIRCSGNPASLLTITAPAASKSYLIINATSTSQSVKIVGTGPTTGVTLVSGESAVVVWNGTDFIKVSSSAVDGVSTFSAGTTGFTPSTATSGAVTLAGTLATTNGGTGLTSFTANRVFYSSSTSAIGQSANLTFDGTTLTANALTTTSTVTINGGTANGVAYLNGSKVLTTGSALTFDGTRLGVGTASPGAKLTVSDASTGALIRVSSDTNGSNRGFEWHNSPTANIFGSIVSNYTNGILTYDSGGSVYAGSQAWSLGTGGEQMRLTSTGLKVGTTSDFSGAKVVTDGGGIGILNKGLLRSSTNGVLQVSADPNNAYASSQISFDVDGSTVATLDSSGRLGIGVTPNTLIDAGGTSSPIIRAISSLTNNAAARMLSDGDTVYFGSQNSSTSGGNVPVVFQISGTERARIDSSGNLRIGLTSAAYNTERLTVYKSGNAESAAFINDAGANNYTVAVSNRATTGDNRFMVFATESSDTTRGSIDYNRAGGLVRYNTTSDYRAKDIIGPVQNPGATIDALKVYEGKMKGATQSRPMLVAHETQAHAPYAVSGVKDEVNEDGTPKFQQMDVSSLVPLLLAELQSLRARVAQLESKGA